MKLFFCELKIMAFPFPKVKILGLSFVLRNCVNVISFPHQVSSKILARTNQKYKSLESHYTSCTLITSIFPTKTLYTFLKCSLCLHQTSFSFFHKTKIECLFFLHCKFIVCVSDCFPSCTQICCKGLDSKLKLLITCI